MAYCANCLEELSIQNIQYAPATFSSYGRRHSDTSKMTLLAARRAASIADCPTTAACLHGGVGRSQWRCGACHLRCALLVFHATAKRLTSSSRENDTRDSLLPRVVIHINSQCACHTLMQNLRVLLDGRGRNAVTLQA